MKLADRISKISISATMKGAAAAAARRQAGIDIVDLTAGEPDFPTPANIKRAAIQSINEDFTKYTPVGGVAELREEVCKRHALDYGTSYSPSECLISVGGKHVVFNLIQVLVDPGDEVIIPVPYWVTYRDVVNYAGGKCVFAETDEQESFHFTASLLERLITPKTRGVIINSPSNPSGAVVPREEFEAIFELALKRSIWILTDECYGRLVYDSVPFSAASLPGARETVFVAGSLSKDYSMTGWRIGYGLAPRPVVEAMLRLQSHTTSNPTSISQRAAIEALRGPQESVSAMLGEYRKRRDYVLQRLRTMPRITCTQPEGAFYVYPNVGTALAASGCHDTVEFANRLLMEADVAVVPGLAFGTDQHVRISCARSMPELERGLDRILDFVAKQK